MQWLQTKHLKQYIQCISRASTALEAMSKTIDKISFVPKNSSNHTYKSTVGDKKAIIQILSDLKPYSTDSRTHSKFTSITHSILDGMDTTKIGTWIKKAQQKLCKHPLYRNLYES